MHIGQQLAAVGCFIVVCGPVDAAIIVQYAAPGGSFAPTTTAAHATASALSDTGSAADLQAGVTLPNSVFLQQNVVSTTPAQAVTNNQFFEFSAAAAPGFFLNLTDLTFNAGRGGSSAPRGWVMRSSLDGFSSTIASGDIGSIQPALTPTSINLGGPAFQHLTSNVVLRLYGYAPSTGVGMFYDDITLNGSVIGNSLVRYEAPGGSFAPTTLAQHISATALTDTGSAADLQTGVTLANSVFLQNNVLATTAAQAVANNQYFEFALGPDAGFQMDLLGVHFEVGRGGSSVPRGWVLRSSLDGFASDIASAEIPTIQPTLTSFDIGLAGPLFEDLQSEVTFRLYDYAPSTGVGAFYDNLMVTGIAEQIVVGAVPEPSSLFLAGIGLVGVLRFRSGKAGHRT